MKLPAIQASHSLRQTRTLHRLPVIALASLLVMIFSPSPATCQSRSNRKITTYLELTTAKELDTFLGAGNRILFLDAMSSIDAASFYDKVNNYTKHDQYADHLLVGIVNVDSIADGGIRELLKAVASLRENNARIDAGGLRQPNGASQLIYIRNGKVLGSIWCSQIKSLDHFREVNRSVFAERQSNPDNAQTEK